MAVVSAPVCVRESILSRGNRLLPILLKVVHSIVPTLATLLCHPPLPLFLLSRNETMEGPLLTPREINRTLLALRNRLVDENVLGRRAYQIVNQFSSSSC